VELNGELRTSSRKRLPAGILGGRRALAVELAILSAALAVQAVLFARGLATPADYDEGVYLAAVDALRHGQELGSDVFTAQPPGFYALLSAGDALVGNSLEGVRSWILILALAGCLAAFLLGRAVGGPVAGLGAALLLGVAPPYPTFASRISADLPAYALGLLALVCVLHAGERKRRLPLIALAGVLFAAAVSVKLSALTLLVPLAGFAFVRRLAPRELAAGGAGAAAVAAAFAIAHRGALRDLWFGAVTYHTRARDVPGPGLGDNAERVLDFLDPRTPFGWLVPLTFLVLLSPWRPRLRAPLWPLWLWSAVAALLLIWHRPLHDNHLVLLAVSLAIPAGVVLGAAVSQLPGRFAVGAGIALALLLAAGFVQEGRRLGRNRGPEPPDVSWAARELQTRTRPDELVVTDRPIVAFLAGRRVPGEVVDSAALAFDAGVISASDILAAVDRHGVRAVVALREFRNQPAVLAGLAKRFPTRIDHGGATLYLRRGR
jgi:4-amino-4-deoxy-L-arabinose transferase-like glycosyltransferase